MNVLCLVPSKKFRGRFLSLMKPSTMLLLLLRRVKIITKELHCELCDGVKVSLVCDWAHVLCVPVAFLPVSRLPAHAFAKKMLLFQHDVLRFVQFLSYERKNYLIFLDLKPSKLLDSFCVKSGNVLVLKEGMF